ncbi:MAG: helix-turn-helix domain-containing protein [Pseudonocardiaceae bacterium]
MARRSGMSASTISRIEIGTIDPTMTTLRRLMEAAGMELVVRGRRRAGAPALPGRPAAEEAEPGASPDSLGRHSGADMSLADLHDAWQTTPVGPRPDWTRLRAFLDHLERHPHLVAAAIATPPRRTQSPMMNALLAGVADKLAADHRLPRPSWTRAAGALKRTWYTPGTPRMRATARAESPPELLRRNIAIREDSLWRPRDLAHTR